MLPGLLLPALLLVAWFVITAAGTGPSLIPTPMAVGRILSRPFEGMLSSGSLAWNSFVSMIRVAMGFSLAALLGIPVGAVMGTSRSARRLLGLSVELSRPLSPLALVPVMLVLFRSRTLVEVLGLQSLRYQHHLFHEIQIGMIMVLFWGGFFPILLGTVGGVRSVRRVHLEAARILGARGLFLFSRVILPSALPDVLTGLRLGIGRCWMVIIAAEMLPGTNAGMGYLIRYSYEVQRLDVMFAGLLIIALLGALLSGGLERLGERSLRLRSEDR